jgi:subtilase family protein
LGFDSVERQNKLKSRWRNNMQSEGRRAASCWLGGAVCSLLATALSSVSAQPDTNWRSRVSADLLQIYRSTTSKSEAGSFGNAPPLARFDSSGRVQIAAYFDCTLSVPDSTLAAAGLAVSVSVKLPPYCVVEGWAAPETLPSITSVTGVKLVQLPVYSKHRPVVPNSRSILKNGTLDVVPSRATPEAGRKNSIDGAATKIMHSDVYAKQTGSNGAGVTVTVISDDVTSLSVIQARGELPRGITVFSSAAHPTPTDEGTMMLEEVHAIAPGASLAFCGVQTEGDYGKCLQEIAAAQVNIIVDDERFPADDLMSRNGTFAQGVQSILAANPGLTLFSSSDNNNQAYWQGPYSPTLFTFNGVPSTLTCTANSQVDSYLENFGIQPNETLILTQPLTALLYLQWADPFGQNTSNFDFYILDASFNVLACAAGAGSPVTFNVLQPMPVLGAGTYYLAIGTPDETLAGKFLKLDAYADGAGTLNITTTGSVDSPQKFISGVQTIGAVDGGDGIGNNIEPFSGTGPIQLEFPSPSAIQAPIFVAPDGVAVDNSGTLFQSNTFFGTSAATPNAAAVLALLESAFPGVPPTSLLTSMRDGAVQLGNGVPNGTFGYGRVDAVGALNAITAPTITPISDVSIVGGQSSGPFPFTMTGVGTLTLSDSSDNSTLVNVGANGGASLTPQGCGTTTNACALTITPTLGQIGNAHVTVEATDGGKRFASTTFTVTVTKPAPPTVKVTGGASQTITEGGAASVVMFVMTGTGPLTPSVVSSNLSLLPNSSISLSSGCGTTTNTCTATPMLATGQTGGATITISTQDPYGQSGAGTARLQVNAPPAPPAPPPPPSPSPPPNPSGGGSSGSGGGGGGAGGGGVLDLWVLLGLGGLTISRVFGVGRRAPIGLRSQFCQRR